MKMIFKKNNLKTTATGIRGKRGQIEPSHRTFDHVAYAAVLEIMG
jgi:hypothetical protein